MFFWIFRTPRDGGYGGCNNDAFSVFGFLAFLLAAANLLMMDAAKRKKRSDDFQECVVGNDNKKEVLEASYSMLRGFLNALDAHDKNCSNYFVCEAAQEAAKLGAVGKTLAGVASANAQSWLLHANETLHSGTEDAGKHGSGELSCLEKYPCKDFHSNYKRPTLI